MTETKLPAAPGGPPSAFGPPTLIKGEHAAAYDDLAARIRAVVHPADVLEEIWMRDVTDLAWEVLRLRRLKASLLQVSAYEGMDEVLDPLLRVQTAGADDEDDDEGDDNRPDDLSERWAVGDSAAIAKVDAALASG